MSGARVGAAAALAAVLLAAPAAGSGQSLASPCRTRDLSLRLGPDVSAMTGEHASLFVLRNHSARSCTLRGYPSVSLFDRHGRILPFRHEDGRGQYVSHRPPRLVLVRPGRRAYFLLAKYRCDRGSARAATRVAIAPPVRGGTLRGPASRVAGDLSYCRGGRSDPGNILEISALVPYAGRAGPG